MLRYRADLQTVCYMLVTTALPLLQWRLDEFHLPLWLASLVMAFAVGAMHHNHAHVAMWHSRRMNTLTDYWFTFFQGHPGYAFVPAHLDNHHRHRNRAQDHTRTWRLRDDNSLAGCLRHPFESAAVLLPVLVGWLQRLRREQPAQFRRICSHYGVLAAALALLLMLDVRKTLLFVMLPQAAALFFLLVSNYLQHAHTDDSSSWNHSRNFLGWLNPLFFNVGYHTAHHHHSRLHWSRLAAAHVRIASRIDPRLIEESFSWYCLRVFFLAPFLPKLRSRPLRGQTRQA